MPPHFLQAEMSSLGTDPPSFTLNCIVAHCFGDNDISDAPDGMYAIAFDDGVSPTPNPAT